MFDNLRDSAESSFYEEEPNDLYKETVANDAKPASKPKPKRRSSNGRLFGMTAQQRFIVSMMLFFTVCILGTLAMFLTGAMSFF